jgi:CysZ protein
MLKLIFRSFMELFESDLRLILVQCCLLALAVILSFGFFGGVFISSIDIFGFDILNSFASWVSGFGFVIIGFILFPSIVLLIGSFFSEKICTRVEERHYSGRIGIRNPPAMELIGSAMRIFCLSLILNLVLIPVYLLGLFIPGLSFIVFYAVNGYLVGGETFAVVSCRHLTLEKSNQLKNANISRITWLGIVIVVLSTVPVVNLCIPIFGIVIMTHIFHQIEIKENSLKLK